MRSDSAATLARGDTPHFDAVGIAAVCKDRLRDGAFFSEHRQDDADQVPIARDDFEVLGVLEVPRIVEVKGAADLSALHP